MSEIIPRFPCCAECPASRTQDRKPVFCAEMDDASDHSYPWGGAVYSLKKQHTLSMVPRERYQAILRQMVATNLDSENEQYYANYMQSVFPPQIAANFYEELKRHAPCAYNPLFSSLHRVGLFDYQDNDGKPHSDMLVYFKIPLPDCETKFTMLPLLFRNCWSAPTQKIRFAIESAHAKHPHMLSEQDTWHKTWQDFWLEQGIDLDDWQKICQEFSANMTNAYQKEIDPRFQILLDQMAHVIESHLAKWLPTPKQNKTELRKAKIANQQRLKKS